MHETTRVQQSRGPCDLILTAQTGRDPHSQHYLGTNTGLIKVISVGKG